MPLIALLRYACSRMNKLQMITFRCRDELFERLERFARARNIDRTSVLKLALHYYLNRCELTRRPAEPPANTARQSTSAI